MFYRTMNLVYVLDFYGYCKRIILPSTPESRTQKIWGQEKIKTPNGLYIDSLTSENPKVTKKMANKA